jgi:hypothetical protein
MASPVHWQPRGCGPVTVQAAGEGHRHVGPRSTTVSAPLVTHPLSYLCFLEWEWNHLQITAPGFTFQLCSSLVL